MLNTWSELEDFLSYYLEKYPDSAGSVLELILCPPNEEIAEIIDEVWEKNPLF